MRVVVVIAGFVFLVLLTHTEVCAVCMYICMCVCVCAVVVAAGI